MIRFSPTGKITWSLLLLLLFVSCSRSFIPVQHEYRQYQVHDSLQPDSSYIRYYQPYKDQLDTAMSDTIGYTDVALTRPYTAPETLLGNFFADALLEAGQRISPDADFSFGTKGGLRIALQKGAITVGNIFELMPFENDLVILELTGDSVQQLAGYIAATGGQPVAGLQMTIRDSAATSIRISGAPLDLSRTYRVVTYDYLANGGDRVKGLEQPLSRINTGKKIRELLIDYIRRQTAAGKTINTQLDGRITIAQ